MKTYDIKDAEANLERLVEKASIGESFVISKDGKQMVKVIPIGVHDGQGHRTGFLVGQFAIPDDFDIMGNREISQMFYGSP